MSSAPRKLSVYWSFAPLSAERTGPPYRVRLVKVERILHALFWFDCRPSEAHLCTTPALISHMTDARECEIRTLEVDRIPLSGDGFDLRTAAGRAAADAVDWDGD